MNFGDINVGDRLLVRFDGIESHGNCNWVNLMNKYNGSVVIACEKEKGSICCTDINGHDAWYYEPEWLTPAVAVDDTISTIPDNILI